MSNKGSAIIARMGLDLNGLRGDLSAAEKLAVRAANRMQSELNNATKGRGGKGTGHGGGSSAGRALGDTINAATGTSGAVNQINMLTHNLGATAGIAAGGIVAVKTLESITRAMIELHDTSNDLEKSLGKKTQAWWEKLPGIPNSLKKGEQLGDRPMEGTEGMRQRRDELAEKSEKAQKARGFWMSMGTAILGSRDSGLDRSIKLQQEADEERLRLDAAIAGKVMKQVEARELLVRHSQHAGELAQIELERVEKIDAIRDRVKSGKIGVEEGHALEKQANAEADLASETADIKADALHREIVLERQLIAIRRLGNDAAVGAAQEVLRMAEETAKAARTKEEKEAAAVKVKAAELEVRLAEKARDIERRGQASAIEMAGLRTDADTKHLAALIAEDRLIQSQQNDTRTTADEQRKLAVDAARNAAAQREHVFSSTGRAFDIGGSLIDAGQGVGQAEAMRADREKLALERSRLTHLQNSPEAGPQAIAEQQAKVAAMARSYADQAFALARSNREAKGQTAEMALQLQHQDSLATAVRTQLDYEEKIRQAKRDGNTELAGQLEKQKQLALQTSVRNADEAKQEKRGLTLGQLATMGGSAGAQARRVNRLDGRAVRLRAAGRIREADVLSNRANAMRQRLVNRGILKPGEAERDNLKTALDASTVLKAIKDNTENLGVNL